MPVLASLLEHVKEEGKGGRSHLYLHHLPTAPPLIFRPYLLPLSRLLWPLPDPPQGLAVPPFFSTAASYPNTGHRRHHPTTTVAEGGCGDWTSRKTK